MSVRLNKPHGFFYSTVFTNVGNIPTLSYLNYFNELIEDDIK